MQQFISVTRVSIDLPWFSKRDILASSWFQIFPNVDCWYPADCLHGLRGCFLRIFFITLFSCTWLSFLFFSVIFCSLQNDRLTAIRQPLSIRYAFCVGRSYLFTSFNKLGCYYCIAYLFYTLAAVRRGGSMLLGCPSVFGPCVSPTICWPIPEFHQICNLLHLWTNYWLDVDHKNSDVKMAKKTEAYAPTALRWVLSICSYCVVVFCLLTAV